MKQTNNLYRARTWGHGDLHAAVQPRLLTSRSRNLGALVPQVALGADRTAIYDRMKKEKVSEDALFSADT